MERRKRLGFTVLEMLVVIGIIAIVGGIAVYNMTRSRERISVERAGRMLRSEVERVRGLAATAGGRLGTGRLQYDNTCTDPGGADGERQLWVRIDAANGTVEIPARLVYDPGADQLTVFCNEWILQDEAGRTTAATMVDVTEPVFAFSATGRVIAPGGAALAAGGVYVRVENADPNRSNEGHGFRVLASGLICNSNGDPNVADCDRDA